MRLGLLRVYRSDRAAALAFRYMSTVNVIAGGLVLTLGRLSPSSIGACIFIAVVTLLFRWRRLRASPFSLLFGANLSVYFVLPLVFLSLMGENFEYGQAGLASVPTDQAVFARSTFPALLFLVVCVVAIACGLTVTRTRVREEGVKTTRRYSQVPVGALAVVVLALTFIGNQVVFARIMGDVGSESLLRFIFFDHAYLILLPVVVSSRLTQGGRRGRFRPEAKFALILAGFLLVATVATSKGFILVLFLFAFIFPLSFLRTTKNSFCFLPTRKFAALSVVGAVLIFIAAADIRTLRVSTDDVGELLRGGWEALANSDVVVGGSAIAYRLGAPLDRYLLLFDGFLWNGSHDVDYAREYLDYGARSFGNLVLPGTPFPESYVTTGNLYPAALEKRPLVGVSTEEELARSLNTQPYTVFGVAVIVCGMLAPVLLFVLAAGLSTYYRYSRSVIVRLSLLYLFHATLHSYGLEVPLANTMHVYVSLVAFMLIAWAVRASGATFRHGVRAHGRS